MPVVDDKGNKLPQSKLKNCEKSAQKRNSRKISNNPKICTICGFHKRGANHATGKHHKAACPK